VPRVKTPTESKTVNVAVPRDLANRLRVVAAHRETTMTETLVKYLQPAIDREYRRCVEAANVDFGGES
jgi:post-segregation antitoxin (ccd killing protein)